MAARRGELLASARGRVLELGAGTGLNLRHYPDGVDLVVSEPDPAMRARLQKRAEGRCDGRRRRRRAPPVPGRLVRHRRVDARAVHRRRPRRGARRGAAGARSGRPAAADRARARGCAAARPPAGPLRRALAHGRDGLPLQPADGRAARARGPVARARAEPLAQHAVAGRAAGRRFAARSRPRRVASAAAAARDGWPSFVRMFATWRCTVCGLTISRAAISPSLSPSATRRRTSASRALSSDGGARNARTAATIASLSPSHGG